MFTYCMEVLHLSEHEAYLRIAAARASRKYPTLLAMLGDGRLHLSGIGKLAPHLTDANCEDVLARAAYKSKREIEELVAEPAPKPDVPASVRKLPTRPESVHRGSSLELVPDRVTELLKTESVGAAPPDQAQRARPAPPPPPDSPPACVVQPLSPARYKVTFTASAELRDKLQRLEALMQEDLAVVIEAAVTEKLERLEAKRFAETKRPRKTLEETDTSGSSRYMPAAVRRVVRKRDLGQCTFVDGQGRRCTERRGLEFHHDDPYGRGGDRSPSNVRLMCKSHNAYLAERDYGKNVMDQYRRSGSRVSESAPVYALALCSPPRTNWECPVRL
ncbi:MAG: HNH endonuclease [Vicinamibacteria bacterium]